MKEQGPVELGRDPVFESIQSGIQFGDFLRGGSGFDLPAGINGK